MELPVAEGSGDRQTTWKGQEKVGRLPKVVDELAQTRWFYAGKWKQLTWREPHAQVSRF